MDNLPLSLNEFVAPVTSNVEQTTTTMIKPQKVPNHDLCDRCGEGGTLLCCDNCPCSFHFYCLDPPMASQDSLPKGEWFCSMCLSTNNIVASETQSIGTMLSDKLHSMNPRLHKLPAWIKEAIPQECSLPKRKRGPKQNECEYCEQAGGVQVHCSLCPRTYHLHCLDPPLTAMPHYFECERHFKDTTGNARDSSKRAPDPYDHLSASFLKLDVKDLKIEVAPLPLVHSHEKDPSRVRPHPDQGDHPPAKRPCIQDTNTVFTGVERFIDQHSSTLWQTFSNPVYPLNDDAKFSPNDIFKMYPIFMQFYAWQKLSSLHTVFEQRRDELNEHQKREVKEKLAITLSPKPPIPPTYTVSTAETLRNGKGGWRKRGRRPGQRPKEKEREKEKDKDKEKDKNDKTATPPSGQVIKKKTGEQFSDQQSDNKMKKVPPKEPRVELGPCPIPLSGEIYPYCVTSDNVVLFRMTKTPSVIGRPGRGSKPDFDVSPYTASKSISHTHAYLVCENELFYLVNIGRNGTALNNVTLRNEKERHALCNSDAIGFGPLRFYFIIPPGYVHPESVKMPTEESTPTAFTAVPPAAVLSQPGGQQE